MFVTSAGYNPTLTIVALAHRAASLLCGAARQPETTTVRLPEPRPIPADGPSWDHLGRSRGLLPRSAIIAFGLVVNLAPDTELALVVDDVGTTAAAALAAFSGLWYSPIAKGAEADPATARTRRGWRFVGLACASWAAGNAVWAFYELGSGPGRPVPVPRRLRLPRLRAPRPDRDHPAGSFLRSVGTFKRSMDMVLVTVGLGGVGWILVLAPVAASTEGALEQGLSRWPTRSVTC